MDAPHPGPCLKMLMLLMAPMNACPQLGGYAFSKSESAAATATNAATVPD